ncbi:uncharacterized protein V1518DRAFT_412793 [Limtongia smithiae]|uniref:uncharacterized protein n=1 Tax=Limtongia smithiae TaxID=1125753 RepID=UPI0034CFEB9C
MNCCLMRILTCYRPIKNRALQRENVFGFASSSSGTRAGATSDPDDPTKFNDDFCSACGGPGRFLCCDGCPRSFHFTCTDPPYDEDNLPEGAWFCKNCYAKRHPPPLPPRGLFSELFQQLDLRNPSCFALPKELRERYEGVTTSDFGEYQDVDDMKPRRINRSGFQEEPDPFKLTDKNGRAILCYKCGKSALHERRIISCDYCPLYWHLDCLDPPMSSIPTSARKWQCPNHIGRDLVQRRRLRNSKVVNVALRRGFLNNGDIEVEDESEDEEIGPESEVLVKPTLLHFLNEWEENPFKKTAFARRAMVESEVVERDGVVYKLPERGIVLDFLDKVNLLSPRRHHRTTPPPSLSELDRLVERPYQEREFVRNLAYFNAEHTDEARERQKMARLFDAAVVVGQQAGMVGRRSEDERR